MALVPPGCFIMRRSGGGQQILVIASFLPHAQSIGLADVGADAGPPNGGAVFHDTAVWVRPA